MSALRAIMSAASETMTPDQTTMRIRLRISLDMVLTLLIVLFTVAITVGYQLLGRRRRAAGPESARRH